MKRRKSNHHHWLLEFYSPVVNTDIDIFSKLITLDQKLKSSMNIIHQILKKMTGLRQIKQHLKIMIFPF